MRRTRFVAFSSVSMLLVAASLLPQKSQTVPLLTPADGEAPNFSSRPPVIAPSGRVAAVATEASNLVEGDADTVRDILAIRLRKGLVSVASVSSTGEKANGDSDDPALDRSGRHVAFASTATNLVDGDVNGVQDIFLHDRRTATTVRVSVASDGTEADGQSQQPWISSNGRLVVFASDATNLVEGDTNDRMDIFLHDMVSGATQRVSQAFDGSEADADSFLPVLSGNGRWLAFLSEARNMVAIDGNASRDVFLRDLRTGAIEMVSVATDGSVSDGHSDRLSISANGRRVAFDSRGQNLDPADQHVGLDVFVRDRVKHTTKLMSLPADGAAADGDSVQPALSANGRWLAFSSAATNLVGGDGNLASDVFRMKLKTGAIERVSVSSVGLDADGNSVSPGLSRNGRYVVFSTRATNLYPDAASNGTWSAALTRP